MSWSDRIKASQVVPEPEPPAIVKEPEAVMFVLRHLTLSDVEPVAFKDLDYDDLEPSDSHFDTLSSTDPVANDGFVGQFSSSIYDQTIERAGIPGSKFTSTPTSPLLNTQQYQV
jgi:hypothetical protein